MSIEVLCLSKPCTFDDLCSSISLTNTEIVALVGQASDLSSVADGEDDDARTQVIHCGSYFLSLSEDFGWQNYVAMKSQCWAVRVSVLLVDSCVLWVRSEIIGENWVSKVGRGNLALFCATEKARSLLVDVCQLVASLVGCW